MSSPRAQAQAATGQVTTGHPEELGSVQNDVSLPLRDYPASVSASPRRVIPLGKRARTLRPAVQDPVVQTFAPWKLSATQGISFEGLGNGNMSITSTPPDTEGAVSDTQYVQWVNDSFAVFNKATGAIVLGPTAGNALWSGFGGACQNDNDGDPVALWDKVAHRWILTQFAVTGGPPYFQCFAISTSSDATGSYYRYAFSFPNFNDYAKMAIWPDAYYIAFNMFGPNNGPFVGAKVCALDRSKVLTGAAATMQCFPENPNAFGFLPSDADGATPPPTGAPNYFVDMGTNSLNIYKFHVDFNNINNTTFTGPVNIPVAAFNEACNGGGDCIPQPDPSQVLESGGDRLMFRLGYRNFGSYESLVVNHSVDAGSGKTALRWYELRNPGGTPSVFQQGTFAPDGNSRWMGSVAMDKAGDIGVGYSVSSSTVHPGIRVTGRVPTDPLGTLQGETTIVNGSGSQLGVARWGDYSAMSIDPTDDCTFWYTQEYIQTDGSFNWYTHINSFKFPNCGASVPVVGLSSGSLSFGNQAVGTSSASQAITLTNTGGSTLSISSIAIAGTNPGDFSQTNGCGSTLAASAHCTITVVFKPTAAGARSAKVSITDNAAGSPQAVSLSGTGTGPTVSLSATSLAFGNQIVGTSSAAQSIKLTNTGTSTLTITAISITGATGDYSKTTTCGGTLAASANCTVSVTFKPTAVGSRTATLSFADNAPGSPQNVSLSGTGVAPVGTVTVTPGSLTFGTQKVGTVSVSQTVTIKNTGTASVTLTSFTLAGDVVLPAKSCGASLAVAASCTLSVAFEPTATGARTGSLKIADSATGSPQTVTMTGTGN